jgi:hypothetical protein
MYELTAARADGRRDSDGAERCLRLNKQRLDTRGGNTSNRDGLPRKARWQPSTAHDEDGRRQREPSACKHNGWNERTMASY